MTTVWTFKLFNKYELEARNIKLHISDTAKLLLDHPV
jgi:hypothetical protein